MTDRTDVDRDRLRGALERVYADFNRVDSAADPVHIVRRYVDGADREVVAFLAASLAFGRVAGVLQSVERVCAVLGPRPAVFLRQFDPRRDGRAVTPLVHRWATGRDLVALLWILRQVLSSGSIERFFLAGYDPRADDVRSALESFSSRARAVDLTPAYGRVPRRPGVTYFFPRPSQGSGCKRLNLFLRWMVRRDAVDFGLWRQVSAAKLVVPLDTHVTRVGQCLGLTARRSPGWDMAAEITASLRVLDPDDPVKYDFALCHLGMTHGCGVSRARRGATCPLVDVCRPAARRPRASRRPSDRR